MTHVGLVLPGGQFFLSAVLRVPAVALGQVGVEVRDVGLSPGFNPSGELEDNREYFDGVGQQMQLILDERPWTEVTFVVKSVGTMILAAVVASLSVPEKVNVLWLTPTFRLNYVKRGAADAGWRSLIVSGTADHWYDPEATKAVVGSLGAEELLIEGGDHNLEVAGDVGATLRALDELAAATLAFIG